MSGGGGAPACGEGKGRAGELQWRIRKLMVRSVWGGRGRRGELHGDPKLGGANGGDGEVLYAREGSGAPFYRQLR
jgi:hypothetical protein